MVKVWLLLCATAFLVGVAAGDFVLPSGFTGLWSGGVHYNILGPWDVPFHFGIARAANGDYLLDDNLNFTRILHDDTRMGWQRFYIESSGNTAGTLWYCGVLDHFGDAPEYAGADGPLMGFTASIISDTQVQACVNLTIPGTDGYTPETVWPWQGAQGCRGCGCASWTLSLLDGGKQLRSQLIMGGGSVHLDVTMTKVGPAPPVPFPMPGHGDKFKCAFQPGGRDSNPIPAGSQTAGHGQSEPSLPPGHKAVEPGQSSCPFRGGQRRGAPPAPPPSPIETKALLRDAATYEHCYILNSNLSLQIEWTLDNSSSTLQVRLSAPTKGPADYIAIGFRPASYYPVGNGSNVLPLSCGTGANFLFGMQGADIVLGSQQTGVKTFYADKFVGEPIPDDSLRLSDTSATYSESTGIASVAFTRPLFGGHLEANCGVKASIVSPAADFLYALGVTADGAPTYHGVTRGVRSVDWVNPEIAMAPFKCA